MHSSIRIALLFATIYSAAALQTALAPSLQVRGATPDFLALLAIMLLLVGRGQRDFLWTALIGLAVDLSSVGPIGPSIACYALFGYAIVRARPLVRFDHLATRLALIAVGAALLTFLPAVLLQLAGHPIDWKSLTTLAGLGGAYTALVALPALMVMSWVQDARDSRGVRIEATA